VGVHPAHIQPIDNDRREPLFSDLLAQFETPLCEWLENPQLAWGISRYRDPKEVPCDPWRCEQKWVHPIANNERVHWFDKINHVGPLRTLPDPRVWELLRVPIDSEIGIGVIETIATWLRIEALQTDGQPVPNFNPLEFSAETPVYSTPGGLLDIDSTSTPFPFPVPHPLDPDAALTVRWWLVRHELSWEQTSYPFWLVGLNPAFIGPREHIIPPWADMRYTWGSEHSRRQHILVQGRAFARLFVEISGGVLAWSVHAGARLAGYFQEAGDLGAAQHAVTRVGT